MPASFTERLDELLGLSSYAGRCASAVAAAERAHFGARYGRKAEPARELRAARRALDAAESRLTKTRGRFLRDFEPDPHRGVAADDTRTVTTRLRRGNAVPYDETLLATVVAGDRVK